MKKDFVLLQPAELQKIFANNGKSNFRDWMKVCADSAADSYAFLVEKSEYVTPLMFIERAWNYGPQDARQQIELSCLLYWYGERAVFHRWSLTGKVELHY